MLVDGIEYHVISMSGLLNLLVKLNYAKSRSDAKRLIAQGGVHIYFDDGVYDVTADDEGFGFKGGEILRVGKHNMIKLVK
jgi:tyrosyl-tRNA synthetase